MSRRHRDPRRRFCPRFRSSVIVFYPYTFTALAVIIVGFTVGCGSDKRPSVKARANGEAVAGDLKHQDGNQGNDSAASDITWKIPELPDNADGANLRTALSKLDPGSIGVDHFWALSRCDCAASFKKNRLLEWRERLGVLPHPLVPDLREGVIKDPQVQLILGLPGALADLLGDLFVDDAELEVQLVQGVQQKLISAVPGGGDFSSWPSFRFELFPSIKNAANGGIVSITEQVAKWGMIWSINGMWDGETPLVEGSHLTQFQQIILSLSEWKYMFGLDKSSITNIPYGGLARSKVSGLTGALAAFDPRTDSAGHGFFAGNYRVAYSQTSSKMDLSVRARETWSNSTEQIDLLTQARLWHTAAVAFARLRPTNRTAVTTIFQAGGGIVADDGHTLPLAFLPGLAALLDGPFINRDDRTIFAATKLDGQPGPSADLHDLSSLAYALGQWYVNLEDLSLENLDDEARSKLESGRASIKQALQLVTQNMLLNTMDESFAHRAEALASLNFVAVSCLDSPFLNSQIIRLTNDFFSDRLGPVLTGKVEPSAEEAIWTAMLLNHLKEQTGDANNQQKLGDLISFFSESIESWSESF